MDDLIDFGKVTEETKGPWLCGFLYDGGAGYYMPQDWPGCYDPWPH